MPLTAQSIVQRVTETLQDSTSVRWPVGELARYFNDGQREIAMHRPDATATTASFTCASGARQTLPAAAAKLLDVSRNLSTSRAIRPASREMLDAHNPSWYGITPSTGVVHYTYDQREPKVFYVYPPATSATSLELVYSAYPTDIAEPSSGTYTAITGNLGVADTFANALVDYILYRAYMKDAEFAGVAGRAQAHYAAFANALGVDLKAAMVVAPSAASDATSVGA